MVKSDIAITVNFPKLTRVCYLACVISQNEAIYLFTYHFNLHFTAIQKGKSHVLRKDTILF